MALKGILNKAASALKKTSRGGKGSPMATKTHGPGHGSTHGSGGHGLEGKAIKTAKKALKK